MNDPNNARFLFIVNPKSGNAKTDWPLHIKNYFAANAGSFEIFMLPALATPSEINEQITAFQPTRVIAAGGDGTVKLVAECLLHRGIPLGILPAGSANGLAAELNIPNDPLRAIDIGVNAPSHAVHLVRINNEVCIHLCDIGFNAALIKEFEQGGTRGKWGYLKACCRIIFNPPVMHLKMMVDNRAINIRAAMVVVANATRYGTGALINPVGDITDEVFEVIAVKKISVTEIFKMVVTHAPYNPDKTVLFRASLLEVQSRKKIHFQVDGEYLGRVTSVKAAIVTGALELVFPARR